MLQATRQPLPPKLAISPILTFKDALLRLPITWTRLYKPSQVKISSMNKLNYILHPPSAVIAIDDEGVRSLCQFKRPVYSKYTVISCPELLSYRQIASANLRCEGLFIRQLHGLVCHESEPGFVGLLYEWIDIKDKMSPDLIANATIELRMKWASQLKASITKLNQINIFWGNAAWNHVLIDSNDNAWVAGFGRPFLSDWADEHRTGTREGGKEAFTKIIQMCRQLEAS